MMPESGVSPSRLFSIFLQLIGIDSESGKEGKISKYIKDFCSSKGFEVHEDSAGRKTGGQSGNLVIKIPSRGDNHADGPMILNAHLDTVPPGAGVCALEDEDRFTSTSDTILGADDKAGLAAILSALETILSSGRNHRALDIVFTVQEEPGLIGAKNIDFSLIDGTWGVVLDGAGEVGGIVLEAPSQDRVRFVIKGRSAHAGVEPENGINAISCAAEVISGLRLGRLDPETTSNIGIIKGGLAVNIVPERVMVEGELRSLSEERLTNERQEMVDRFSNVAESRGCSLDVEIERSFHHFKVEKESRTVRLLCKAMEESRVTSRLMKSGGGSDANVFNRRGLNVATMNIGIINAHSREEYILKEDLAKVAGIVLKLATIEI